MRWRDAGAYLRDSPVLGLIFCVCYASERISVGYWIGKLTRRPQDSQFYGWYVVGWLVALLLMLGLAPASGSWAVALAWLGLYRLQDMLFGTITDAFGFVRFAGSWQSKVVLAIFNIVQVVTIFARRLSGLYSGPGLQPAAAADPFRALLPELEHVPAARQRLHPAHAARTGAGHDRVGGRRPADRHRAQPVPVQS